jgi:hypothetical protein
MRRLAIYFRDLKTNIISKVIPPSSGLNTPHSLTVLTKAKTKSLIGETDPDFQVSI